MATLIQVRRDTQANWTANNPILAAGEIAFSTDQYRIKIGDGTSNWSTLDYMTATATEITNQINAAISGLIDSAPETLNTLNEIAAAINDDANFFNTVATINSPSFTGSITLDSKVNLDTSTTLISANTATTINALAASSYRSAEYLIQVSQGAKQTLSKVIMLHDGTTANIAEYGVIELGSPRIPLTISATLSGGNVLLQATITDAETTSASVEVIRTAIVV
jgi:hypothetical protein